MTSTTKTSLVLAASALLGLTACGGGSSGSGETATSSETTSSGGDTAASGSGSCSAGGGAAGGSGSCSAGGGTTTGGTTGGT